METEVRGKNNLDSKINQTLNKDLRRRIVEMITKAGEGHIPSAFSIVDIISLLYSKFLKTNPKNPQMPDRDYFVLSKGHGCAGLYVVLEKFGFLKPEQIDSYGQFGGILGGHPDRTKVPGAEASTGSLGHGISFAMGIAHGIQIQKKANKVVCLVGDGECHEGTVWETALVAQNLKLKNFCVVVDYNGSAAQILPHPDLVSQWRSFGWEARIVDGHSEMDLSEAFQHFFNGKNERPLALIAQTVKGKGVARMETHGPWHHKIPTQTEFDEIMAELQ